MHYYVFSHYIRGIPVYERTCGSVWAADRRVIDLQDRGHLQAFYTVDKLPKQYWY